MVPIFPRVTGERQLWQLAHTLASINHRTMQDGRHRWKFLVQPPAQSKISVRPGCPRPCPVEFGISMMMENHSFSGPIPLFDHPFPPPLYFIRIFYITSCACCLLFWTPQTLSSGWTSPALILFSYSMCFSPRPPWWPTHWFTPVCQCLSCTEPKTAQTAQDVTSSVPNRREPSVLLTCWLPCCLYSPIWCCLFILKLLFIKTPRDFSGKGSPASQAQPVPVQGVILSQMQDPVVVFAELSKVCRALSAHSSGLPTTLRVTALPSSTSSTVPSLVSSLKFAEGRPCLIVMATNKGIWTVLSPVSIP